MAEPENSTEHWMVHARQRSKPVRLLGGGLLLMAFGGVFLYFLLPELLMNLSAAGWREASCGIVSSRVVSMDSADPEQMRKLYRPEIRYSYELAGRRYESTRYRFASPFTDNEAGAAAAVRQYAPGSRVTCFVNTALPTQAVLERQLAAHHLFILIPLVFLLAGLWNVGAALARLAGRV